MAEGKYPSVFVVDSHTNRPPVPPRLSSGRQRVGAAQTLLFLLVSLALCGMVIEACFIFHLYQPEFGTSGSLSKHTGEDVAPPTEEPMLVGPPSKPAAHLTGGQDVSHGKQVMAWSMVADPILHEMGYDNGSLLIQKEGYYYVYSKVSFVDSEVFHHSIQQKTKRYGKNITLLKSRRYSSKSTKMRSSNSYLGGVFHLHKDDAIFVQVSNTSKILRYESFENAFGAYMI